MIISPTIGSIDILLGSFLKQNEYSRITVIVDENTEKCCLPIVTNAIGTFDVIKIKSGEENKNLATCQDIWQSLTNNNYDRQGVIINLGGGVIGDMGGFCAATFKRGLSFINIPTTLLAMVDASVGGKLGVDFGSFKNQIGLFQNPDRIFIDPIFLRTLPKREMNSGFAEIIKHALITKSDDWSRLIQSDLENMDWTTVIQKSVAIKSEVVSKDFKESGLRKILNFGHTIGHAIESYFLEQGGEHKLLHGEAVAIGMICESYISAKKIGLSKDSLAEIVNYISSVYERIDIPEVDYKRILELCDQDKKNAGNKIQAVLLKSIGTPTIDSEIASEEILDALRYYSDLNI